MKRKIRRVGLCTPPLPIYLQQIAAGIGEFYHRHNQWEVYPTWPSLVGTRNLLRQKQLDGVLVWINAPEWLPWLKKTGLPAVEVSFSGQTELPRVGVDDVAVGRLAAQYFLQRGHRRLGFCGLHGVPFSQTRRRGFMDEADQAGIRVWSTEIPARQTRAANEVFWAINWLQTLPRPIGVMASHDQMGMILTQACRLAGLRVPEDVAVLGVDNNAFICSLSIPPLSSIDTLPERLGFEAAALLDRLMAGQPAPDRPLLFPPGLITTRQSSDLVAVEDEVVREALRFIRSRIGRPTSVKEVVAELAVSRRLLECRFHSILGRTIRQEIQRVTIERARELLTYTDLSLAQVAEKCGYPLLCNFSTMFRKLTKTSPSAFRRAVRPQKLPLDT